MLLCDIVNLLSKDINNITLKFKDVSSDNINYDVLECCPGIAFCVPIENLTEEDLHRDVLEIIPNFDSDGACFVIGEW